MSSEEISRGVSYDLSFSIFFYFFFVDEGFLSLSLTPGDRVCFELVKGALYNQM